MEQNHKIWKTTIFCMFVFLLSVIFLETKAIRDSVYYRHFTNNLTTIAPTENYFIKPTSDVYIYINTSTATPGPPLCRIGTTSDCESEPALVPDSDGTWAYDVFDGVYFEYPSDWIVTQHLDSRIHILSLIPPLPTNPVAELKPTSSISIIVKNNVVAPEGVSYNTLTCETENFSKRLGSRWHKDIKISDFEGSEFLWANNPTFLDVNLYNPKSQTMICLSSSIYNTADELAPTPELAKENFPNFYHVLESIKIWNE